MSTHQNQNVQIQPELLDRLAKQARENGDTVNGLLQRMLDESEVASGKPQLSEMSPQERARAWREWITEHAVSVDHPVDVSRDSIYTREDEAL